MPNTQKYDLEERTAKFGENILFFCRKIPKKESRESKHFLRMFAIVFPEYRDEIAKLWSEAKEINLIFNSIYNKVK